MLNRRRLRESRLRLPDREGVVDADERFDLCGSGAVDDVLLRELHRAGHEDGAELVQRHGADPVFPPLPQDQQHDVALPDAERTEKIRAPVRHPADLGKGQGFFAAVVVDPEEGPLFGLLFCPGVHDVEAEVEILRDVDPVIFFKILVGVKLDTRKKLIQKHFDSSSQN